MLELTYEIGEKKSAYFFTASLIGQFPHRLEKSLIGTGPDVRPGI